MNRLWLLIFLLLPLAARAQMPTIANVVANCGTPNSTYSAGQNAPVTQDTTGKVCDSSSGAGGLTNLYNTGVSVGNGADTTEDTLQTFVVPAGQLANVGDRIIIEAGGVFIGSTDTRTARIRVGGASFGSIAVTAAGQTGWTARIVIMKTGSNTQGFNDAFTSTTGVQTISGTSALTDTSTITILVTGQNTTNSVANSITCRYMTVDFIP